MAEKYFTRTINEYEVFADIDKVVNNNGIKDIITEKVVLITDTCNRDKIEKEIRRKFKEQVAGNSISLMKVVKRSTTFRIPESVFMEHAVLGDTLEETIHV